MSLLIDTHVWWWLENGFPGRMSAAARRQIEDAERNSLLWISSMSAWEIAMLDSKRRLEALPDPLSWIRRSLSAPGRTLVPLSPEIAVVSNRIPDAPVADPIDLILLATVLVEGATLMTADRKLLNYGKRHRLSIVPV